MGLAALQKKHRSASLPEQAMAKKEKRLRAEISLSAGLGRRREDPVAIMTQSYKQSFDAVGSALAAGLGGKALQQGGERDQGGQNEQSGGRSRISVPLVEAGVLTKKHDFPEYSHSRRQREQNSFFSRFSAAAFRGGRLAGAVLEGQAKNMFISCAARSLYRAAPQNEKQRRVLGDSAIEKDMDSQPARVTFNRDVRSAVAITVDAIHGAGRVLDIFRELAEGSGELHDGRLEQGGVSTIRQLYPFLCTDSDKALIKKYSEKLKLLENDKAPEAARERQALMSALKKARGVLDKKQSEQRSFLTQLTYMQNRAREAEMLFTSEGFAESVAEEIEAAAEAAPPDDGKGRRRTLNAEEADDTRAGTAQTDESAERQFVQEQPEDAEHQASETPRESETPSAAEELAGLAAEAIAAAVLSDGEEDRASDTEAVNDTGSGIAQAD